MPDITFTAGPYTRSRTVSAAKLQRIVAAYRIHYGAELTDQQVAEAVLDGFIAQIRAVVQQHEARVAETVAREAVTTFEYD
jgi:hypothetical protein